MPTAGSAAPVSARSDAESRRLTELLQQAEAGQPLELTAVEPLTKAGDPATRGLAKSLLAKLIVEQARWDSCRLLCEACADLDYRHPKLNEDAMVKLYELKAIDQLFEFQTRAAERAARRPDHLAALVHVHNAISIEFRMGGLSITRPEALRRLIAVYEQVARETRASAGVRPATRRQRRSPAGGKLRLAHCVCQLVDGGHAPSRVTDTLLQLADRERFDPYLVVTEAIVQHPGQPHQMVTSPASNVRAPKLIERFERELSVPVLRPRGLDTFLAAAADLHRQIAEHQIDILFFHGSLVTPTDWLLCAWQAAPWQFDRGFGHPLYCPAVDYQFFELAPTMETLAFLCRERGIPYGLSPNGAIDMSHVAAAEPLPRAELGIPADHVVLGTIGNNLPKRMGAEFCQVLAAVLRAFPKTTYLVIGAGEFETQPQIFGRALIGDNGPGARVRFMGQRSEIARWTQMLDIYVNEYPGGGGTSVCEAMACGKPVVCMQANEGCPAVVGAVYVGEENLVRPPTNEAYAQRLIELINSPHERQAFGDRLRRRQQEEFDAGKFVRGMEEKIWEVVHQTGDQKRDA